MTDQALQALCTGCGGLLPEGGGVRAVRCAPCFDGYLRSVDAGFLEHYAEFGVRSRQVVAETSLRALALANTADRKLLAMNVYEQFVGAASDLIAMVAALRDRREAPIARTFLDFRLNDAVVRRFFADMARLSGIEVLEAVGLPAPEAVRPGMPRRVERDVKGSLRQALADLPRLNEYRDLGERALALAADHFGGAGALAGRTEWLAGRELAPGQVASVALDLRRGRLDIAALRVDEERLAQVVDAIDVMTRLARNLAYAFMSIYDQPAFVSGFREAQRVRAG